MANHLSDQQFLRYSAQIMLPEIGECGQLKLANAKVLLIGLGGLGNPVAAYLAAAGVGYLYLVDDDEVELSNLQRQVLYRPAQLKQAKAQAAAAQLSQQNPLITLSPIQQRFSLDSDAYRLVADVNLVIDCSDNMATRQLINQACVRYKTALIVGAAIGFDGQLISFDANQLESACYHCLYPFSDTEGPQNCAALGILGPVVGTIGSLQALEAIKYLAGLEMGSFNRLLRFDGKTLQSQHLAVSKNSECVVCGQQRENTNEINH